MPGKSSLCKGNSCLARTLYVRVTRGWQGLFVQVRHKSSKGSPCQHDSCLARVSYVKVTYAKGSLCKGGMPGKGSLSKGESWLARAIYIRRGGTRRTSLTDGRSGQGSPLAVAGALVAEVQQNAGCYDAPAARCKDATILSHARWSVPALSILPTSIRGVSR
ncbi:hypothetical protein J6590_017702 [Homalodisca vitripennis]|nr:hypothetical protein J6590_017702 [Homalodisca vitripennis]